MNKPKAIVQLETVISHKHACATDRIKKIIRTCIPRVMLRTEGILG